MATGVLTPLQLIAGSGLLQNQGISVSPDMALAISAYSDTSLMAAFFRALSVQPTLATLGANSCPMFSNSVPGAYSSLGTQLTTVVTAQGTADFAGGDISKFIQGLNIAVGYADTTNTFINSAVNSQTYLANTFAGTNSSITGDITQVSLATTAFGSDLVNLGSLIDLSNLGNLGSPFALVQRIVTLLGNVPVLAVSFLAVGVPQEVVINLTSPTLSVTDSIQKLMYQAMTQITGSNLDQILKVLKITTTGIDTMADLLNPVKLFPNSYLTLTVTTANGTRAIYMNDSGAVNSKLVDELPAYVVNATGFSTQGQLA